MPDPQVVLKFSFIAAALYIPLAIGYAMKRTDLMSEDWGGPIMRRAVVTIEPALLF